MTILGLPGRLQLLLPDSLATPGPRACACQLSVSLSLTHTNGISHTYIWCLSHIRGSNTVPHTHMASRPKHTQHRAHTARGHATLIPRTQHLQLFPSEDKDAPGLCLPGQGSVPEPNGPQVVWRKST